MNLDISTGLTKISGSGIDKFEFVSLYIVFNRGDVLNVRFLLLAFVIQHPHNSVVNVLCVSDKTPTCIYRFDFYRDE